MRNKHARNMALCIALVLICGVALADPKPPEKDSTQGTGTNGTAFGASANGETGEVTFDADNNNAEGVTYTAEIFFPDSSSTPAGSGASTDEDPETPGGQHTFTGLKNLLQYWWNRIGQEGAPDSVEIMIKVEHPDPPHGTESYYITITITKGPPKNLTVS